MYAVLPFSKIDGRSAAQFLAQRHRRQIFGSGRMYQLVIKEHNAR